METRLDRIERYIEEFTKGMLELKESQKKTDAQQNRTDEQLNRTDSQILELKESQKKTDSQIFELRESQKKTDSQIFELRESQKKTDSQIFELRESQKKTDEQLRMTIKKLDEVGRQLGDQGLVQGEVAEDLFYRNVGNLFKPTDFRFSRIRRNVRKKGFGEYDIVAENGGQVLVIEVKNKLEKRMVDKFMEEKLPKFKQIFPEFKTRKILGGIGALVVKDEIGRYAEKMGLYVLTQADDGGAALFNKKGFKPKEFA